MTNRVMGKGLSKEKKTSCRSSISCLEGNPLMYIGGVSINFPENKDFDFNFSSSAPIWKIQTWLRTRACLDQGEESIKSNIFQT
jgi:hypothetical protein